MATRSRADGDRSGYAPYLDAVWGLKNHWYPGAVQPRDRRWRRQGHPDRRGADPAPARRGDGVRAARPLRAPGRETVASPDLPDRGYRLVLVSRLHLRAGGRQARLDRGCARGCAHRQGPAAHLSGQGVQRHRLRLRRRPRLPAAAALRGPAAGHRRRLRMAGRPPAGRGHRASRHPPHRRGQLAAGGRERLRSRPCADPPRQHPGARLRPVARAGLQAGR